MCGPRCGKRSNCFWIVGCGPWNGALTVSGKSTFSKLMLAKRINIASMERPDPRSRFQPDGVHGASRLIDIESFRWTDAGFQARPLASAVIYELHVSTFTTAGTFEAAIERLDHLTQLGVTHVELMPIAEFAGVRGWGYDGVFPFAPHHSYGGPKGLAKLVNACHLHGIGVLLDVVYNHLGPTGNCSLRLLELHRSRECAVQRSDRLHGAGPLGGRR